jgi:hypothetical protein
MTEPHPTDHIHRLLTEIVARLPWHSEEQQNQMMALLRDSEGAAKDGSDAMLVVPPASPMPEPTRPMGVQAGESIDYDKLAAAIVAAQATADQQRAQAAAAVSAEPGFVPPGAETVPPSETHATLDS